MFILFETTVSVSTCINAKIVFSLLFHYLQSNFYADSVAYKILELHVSNSITSE